MLTTFRCSFGDCSTLMGTPIFGSTFGPANGAVLSFTMSALIFFTTVGLLNVISALFLERIMANAEATTLRSQQDRLNNKKLFNREVQKLLRILQRLQHEADVGSDANKLE